MIKFWIGKIFKLDGYVMSKHGKDLLYVLYYPQRHSNKALSLGPINVSDVRVNASFLDKGFRI